MATATMSELDEEIQSLIPAETEKHALVLQGVVNLEKIADAAMYLRVSAAGTDAATNVKRLKAIFEPICAARYERHKRATQLLADKIRGFEQVKRRASELIGAYDVEQERKRREEENRLQCEADAEAKRIHDEQVKLANEEGKRLSEDQALADAAELAAAGDHKAAEQVLNNPAPVPVYVPPVFTPPVILQKSVPKAAGKSSITVYDWRVKQSQKCRAVAPHKPEECSICLEEVPRQYLILDTKTIGQLVKATKEKTAIPGIDVFPSSGARFRG
jgi:hypothetical protein